MRQPLNELDYATPGADGDSAAEDCRWLVTLDMVSAFAGALIWFFAGDRYGPLAAVIVGVPLLIGQAVVGGVAAVLGLQWYGKELSRGWKVSIAVLAVLPLLITIAGIVAAWAAPGMKGSR